MNEPTQRLRFFRGGSHPCPYLPDREADSAVADPSARMSPDLLAQLTAAGFRRSGSIVYRPYCGTCTACVALRLPVAQFAPRRSQRRIWQRNADATVKVTAPGFSEERFALYDTYLAARHSGAGMDNPSRADFERFLDSDWSDTRFHETRIDGKLAAIAVTDWLPDALSAVYTFFDPGLARRALGVHSVLAQIDTAQREGLRWLYLGYWIENCQKMDYKRNFQPAEAYLDNGWTALPPAPQLLASNEQVLANTNER